MRYKFVTVKKMVYKGYVNCLRRILGVLGLYDPLPLGQMDEHTLSELEE